MNERIRELALQAGGSHYPEVGGELLQKFAELLIKDCLDQLSQLTRVTRYDDEYRRGAEITALVRARIRIEELFEVKQNHGWVCPKCSADRTKIACPLGFGASVDGRCPMTAEAQ